MKLKDIKGLLVEKKKISQIVDWGLTGFGLGEDHYPARRKITNKIYDSISLQGERSLTLNRKKLLLILKDTYREYQHGKISPDKSGAEHMADAILSALPEILESVKE